jgi:hypothetical protein
MGPSQQQAAAAHDLTCGLLQDLSETVGIVHSATTTAFSFGPYAAAPGTVGALCSSVPRLLSGAR